jgi:ABC-type branched-subunit amino acid transport system ATPase component
MFVRAVTRMMQNGRMDLDVTLCDHNMDILCLSRQTIVVLEAERKFAQGKKESLKPSL